MRKVLRFLVGSFLIVAALLVAYHYSSDTAIYECSGMVTKDSNPVSGPIKLFIKLKQNRWWSFWNPVNGILRWEYADGRIPIVPGDDRDAPRWLKTGPDSVEPAPPFVGLLYSADGREDFFVINALTLF